MGKKLIIKGADFSVNGTQIVDPDAIALAKIKSEFVNNYYEHLRYHQAYMSAIGTPSDAGDTRNACGPIEAVNFDYQSFKVIVKNGCKVAPIQCTSTSDGLPARYSFAWTTEDVVYDDLQVFGRIGINVAYQNDAVIPTGTELWEFIDIELVQ